MRRAGLAIPVRSADAELVDAFFVAAIASVLLIRIYLEATGYPRLGGGGLHIAHVLWGGLGMLIAIVLLLVFLSSTTRFVAAIVGGVGFGAFIDELGKFLTSDNDYFFQPTAALVYVVFVLLFLAVRQVRTFRSLTPAESFVNAVEIAERLALGPVSAADRDRALDLLTRADQSEPLVAALRARFASLQPASEDPSAARSVRNAVGRWYAAIAGSTAFRRVIAGIFILDGISFLLTVLSAVAMLGGALLGIEDARVALDESLSGSTATSWIQVFAGIIAGGIIVRGVIALRGHRARAYHLFELAILIDLLLAQPFAFLESGFVATVAVFVDLGLLAILRFLDTQEHRMFGGIAGRQGALA